MILPEGFVPHWLENLDDETYHSNRDFVSSSALKKIITKSPRTFQSEFLLGQATPTTKAMNFGRLIHQVVLDGAHFLKTYTVMPPFEGHHASTLHKQKKAEWLAEHEGLVIVNQKEFDDLRFMLESVIEHEDAFALLKDGAAEVSGYYRDPQTGIACRIRPDFLSPGLGAVVDLKSTISCEQNDFSWSMWKYRYDFQLAMYTDGANEISGRKFDMQAIIAVEKTRPYETAVYIMDNAAIEKGRGDYRRALRRYRECLDTGVYPRYQRKMQPIGLPQRAMIQDYEGEEG